MPDNREVKYLNMLDRSWTEESTEEVTDNETELLELVFNNQDKFMSMICSVHLDLDLEEKEDRVPEDQTASADNIMVI